jgi:hypothetical protein
VCRLAAFEIRDMYNLSCSPLAGQGQCLGLVAATLLTIVVDEQHGAAVIAEAADEFGEGRDPRRIGPCRSQNARYAGGTSCKCTA